MPALFVFLLKVNIALIICCLGYYLVLRQLTFYTLNRVYLVIAIVFSSVYPLIDINDFVQRHQQIAIPVQRVVLNWQAPAQQFVQQPQYWYWATLLFWTGAIVFASRLVMQLFSLYKIYKNSSPDKIQDHPVRIVKANISPFSFWQSIYINPDNLNPQDLESILQHEQVHVKQWHTIDILLSEISVVFYWFNPGVWLMKKAVRENIEFITDRKILQKGIDSKSYQYSLLNVSFNVTKSAAITNHFNFSTLKKRIIMMNAKRSASVNLTRYAFLVPAVLICLFTISLSKAELVKKSKIAYKAIAAHVNNLVTATNTPVVKKPIAKKPLDTVSNKKAAIIETAALTYKPDTDKIVKLSPKTDSATIYINGVKSTDADLSKLNPNNIATFSVTKGNDGGVIFVTTKKDGSTTETTGNATINGNKTLNDVIVVGYGVNGKTVPLSTVPVTGKVSTTNMLSKLNENKPLKEITVTGYKINDGAVINVPASKTIPAAAITQFHMTTGNAAVANQAAPKLNENKPLKEVTITGHKVNNATVSQVPVEVIVDGITFKRTDMAADNVSTTNQPASKLNENKPLKEVTIISSKVDDATVANIPVSKTIPTGAITKFDMDHHPSYKFEVATVPMRSYTDFTGKLIFIDGKEASKETQEKLPASKIVSITVNNSRDMIEKYGDKAAKGVIFIITKKADK